MRKSWSKIRVHIYFTTKDEEPSLSNGLSRLVADHIRENAIEKEIPLDCIFIDDCNVHILVILSRCYAIADIARYLKGESSRWINENKLLPERFQWEAGYYAKGIGRSEYLITRKIILGQHRESEDSIHIKLQQQFRK